MNTAEGITSRVRAALDTAGIAPARLAEELCRPVAFVEDMLSGVRPVSCLAVAVAAELSGEDVGYLTTGERRRFQVIGPCVMPGDD